MESLYRRHRFPPEIISHANGPRSPPTGEAKRQGTAKNQTPNPAHPNRAQIHIHLRGQVTAHVREEPQVLR